MLVLCRLRLENKFHQHRRQRIFLPARALAFALPAHPKRCRASLAAALLNNPVATALGSDLTSEQFRLRLILPETGLMPRPRGILSDVSSKSRHFLEVFALILVTEIRDLI